MAEKEQKAKDDRQRPSDEEQESRSSEEDPSGRPSGEPSEKPSGGQSKKEEPSPWEWVVAAVGALLVLSTVGFMLYEALSEPATPPLVFVEVDRVLESAAGYLVPFTAHNRGQTTAARLVIEGQLKQGAETVETSTVTFDYLPAEASRQGGLFFSQDPTRYQLEIRPKGYDRP